MKVSSLDLNSPRWRLIAVVVIFAAAIYRWAPRYDPIGAVPNTGYESLNVAYSLAHNQGFANPFKILQSGPTAHLAPIFPFFLSILVRLFGDGSRTLYIVDWAGIAAFALQLALWPLLARRLSMGFGSGALGAMLWLTIGYKSASVWEANYAAIVIIVLSIGMYNLLTRHCPDRHFYIVALLWGFAILLLPVVVLPFVVFCCWLLARPLATRRQKLAFVIISVGSLMPWTLRNYATFHHLFFIRDNLGLELGVSNNECADFSFQVNALTWCYIHPNQDPEEARRVQELGEYNYNQQRLQEVKAWISANPERFATLTLQRIVAFWIPNSSGNPATSTVAPNVKAVWISTLLSLPGLLLLWWRDRVAATICLVWLVFFPPIYYLVQFDLRYRTPIMWATVVPACYVFTRLGSDLLYSFRAQDAAENKHRKHQASCNKKQVVAQP